MGNQQNTYEIRVYKNHNYYYVIKDNQTGNIHSFSNYYGVLNGKGNLELYVGSIGHDVTDLIENPEQGGDLLDLIERIESDKDGEDNEGNKPHNTNPYEVEDNLENSVPVMTLTIGDHKEYEDGKIGVLVEKLEQYDNILEEYKRTYRIEYSNHNGGSIIQIVRGEEYSIASGSSDFIEEYYERLTKD